MHKQQRVADMATEVLAREAKAEAERGGKTYEKALEDVAETEAGQHLVRLRDGADRDESAEDWQADLARKREEERARAQREQRNRDQREAQREATWERFMESERRELDLRKDGQLAKLLGEPLPQEPPAQLRRLAAEDQRQAEAEMVALASNGKVVYKHIEELREEDMPARIAANRLRESWLKERQEVWFRSGKGQG